MALINGKEFSRLTRSYCCDDEVLRQIREFIMTSIIPDRDIVLNHCPVVVNDLSKRLLLPPRQTRYFDVGFQVMYYQTCRTIEGEPVLEITYEAAEELTKDEFERRKGTLPVEEVQREAREVINSAHKTEYNG